MSFVLLHFCCVILIFFIDFIDFVTLFKIIVKSCGLVEGELDKYVHLVYANFCWSCRGFALWLWNANFSFIFFSICCRNKTL